MTAVLAQMHVQTESQDVRNFAVWMRAVERFMPLLHVAAPTSRLLQAVMWCVARAMSEGAVSLAGASAGS
jgi:hypothetical protein